MKGLYTNIWKGSGLDSKEQADGLLAFAKDNGFTDLFIHRLNDRTVPNTWWVKNRLRYILDNKGDLKIHAYYSGLMVGRWFKNNESKSRNWIDDGYPTAALMEYKCSETSSQMYLDPVAGDGAILIQQIHDDLLLHPDIDGIHLDKMRYPIMRKGEDNYIGKGSRKEKEDALNGLMQQIRALTEKPITLAVRGVAKDSPDYDLSDYASWKKEGVIDDYYPMLVADDPFAFEAQINQIPPVNTIIHICKKGELAMNESQYAAIKDNYNIIFFSYAAKDDLPEAVRNGASR